jgi:hypothetical protein
VVKGKRYLGADMRTEYEGEMLKEMQKLEPRSENASPKRARDARLSALNNSEEVGKYGFCLSLIRAD